MGPGSAFAAAWPAGGGTVAETVADCRHRPGRAGRLAHAEAAPGRQAGRAPRVDAMALAPHAAPTCHAPRGAS